MSKLTIQMDMRELFGDMYRAITGEESLKILAEAILDSIKEGLRKNINTDNQPLLPYSKNYEKHKLEKGFDGKVDFTYKGFLIKGLRYKVTKTGFKIYPNSERNKNLMRIWALEGYKNWTVFQWGKRLNTILDEMMMENFYSEIREYYVAS